MNADFPAPKKPVRSLFAGRKPASGAAAPAPAPAPEPAPEPAPVPAPAPAPAPAASTPATPGTPSKSRGLQGLKTKSQQSQPAPAPAAPAPAPEPAPAPAPAALPPRMAFRATEPAASSGPIASTPPPDVMKSPLFPNATSGIGYSRATGLAGGLGPQSSSELQSRGSTTGSKSLPEYAPASKRVSADDHDGTSGSIVYSIQRMLRLQPNLDAERVEMPAGAAPFDIKIEATKKQGHGNRVARGGGKHDSGKFGGDRAPSGASSGTWNRNANKPKSQRHDKKRNRDHRRKHAQPSVAPRHVDNVQAFLGSAADKSFSKKRQQQVSNEDQVMQTVMACCNKMSRDNFRKLLNDILALNITSMALLDRVADLVLERALETTFFQDLYADMVNVLAKESRRFTDNFLQIEALSDKLYYNCTGRAFAEMSEAELKHALKCKHIGCIPKDERAKLAGDEAKERAELHKLAVKNSSFQRMLLNHCSREFKNWPGDFEAEQQKRAKAIEEGKWTDAEQEAFDLKETLYTTEAGVEKRRKRFLALVSFVGHLYKLTDTMNIKILNQCFLTLLKSCNPDDDEFRSDALEALVHLLLLVGAKVESKEHRDKRAYFQQALDHVGRLSKSKTMEKRLVFKCLDVLEARRDGWVLPESHAASFKKILSVEEFRKEEQAKEQQKAAELSQLMSKSHKSSLMDSRHARFSHDPRGVPAQLGSSFKGKGQGAGWSERHSLRSSGRAGGAGAAAAASSAPAKPSVDIGALAKKAVGILEEYAASQDTAEMKRLLQKLPKHGGAGVIAGMLQTLQASAKPDIIEAVPDIISEAAELKLVTAEDLPFALGKVARKFRALKTDSPKLATYVAEVVSPFIASGAIKLRDVLRHIAHGQAQMAGAAIDVVVQTIAELDEDKVDTEEVMQLPWLEAYGPGGFMNSAEANVKALDEFLDTEAASEEETQLGLLCRLADWRRSCTSPDSAKAAWEEMPTNFQRNTGLGAAAVVELVSLCASTGMGGNDGDGEADVEELNSFAPAIRAITNTVQNKDELAERVLEGTARAVATEEMYEDEWRAGLFVVFVKALQTLGVVNQAQVKSWASHPLESPADWAHADAVKALKGKGAGL